MDAAGASLSQLCKLDVEAAETRMHEILVQHGVEVDYATVRHADTLGPPVEGFASRALIAGRVPQAEGGVRLIDNAFTKAGT